MSKVATRNIVIALVLILVAGGIFGFMVYQVEKQGKKLDAQIDVLAQERAREVTYYQLVKVASDSTDQREEIRSHFLFRESDSIDFLNRIEQEIAPAAEVALDTRDLDLIEDNVTGEKWVEVSFTFTGTRERVQRFVKILENLPYVLRVSEVIMSARSSTDWKVDLTMQVRVLSYDS